MQHKGTNTIETIRLVLRRFRIEDAGAMYRNWAGDPQVCKYLSWGPHRDEAASRSRIREWVSRYGEQNFYVWAIEIKNQGMPVGSISVEISNEQTSTCEIGYCIGRDYWNRGIMTEALRAIMHYLFFEIGYVMIQAKHDILNTASGKVMQKAGMKYARLETNVGTRRDGTQYDCVVYQKNIADQE
ncbi:MAG TPA: GNAT family N-acetyltransferase [Clostridiales bacterium]|nr:GNAT family N-acetyltransferase [Clostridiales bacterium]